MSSPEGMTGMTGMSLINWRLKRIETEIDKIKEQHESIEKWLRGLMASTILSLLLLVVKLLKG